MKQLYCLLTDFCVLYQTTRSPPPRFLIHSTISVLCRRSINVHLGALADGAPGICMQIEDSGGGRRRCFMCYNSSVNVVTATESTLAHKWTTTRGESPESESHTHSSHLNWMRGKRVWKLCGVVGYTWVEFPQFAGGIHEQVTWKYVQRLNERPKYNYNEASKSVHFVTKLLCWAAFKRIKLLAQRANHLGINRCCVSSKCRPAEHLKNHCTADTFCVKIPCVEWAPNAYEFTNIMEESMRFCGMCKMCSSVFWRHPISLGEP